MEIKPPSLPLPHSKIKDGKMVNFGSCLTPSLILGDGGLLFHVILSKIVANCELLLSKANPLGQKNIFFCLDKI